jgi:hypothetical protein
MTVSRLYESLQRTEEKKSKLLREKIDEEMKPTKHKAEISKGSQRLIKMKGLSEQKPIFDRTQEILEKTKEKSEKIRIEMERKKEENEVEPTFQPSLVAKKTKNIKSRTLSEFTEFQMKWKQSTDDEILRLRCENLTKSLAEVSFKPNIDNLSKKIVERVSNFFIYQQ